MLLEISAIIGIIGGIIGIYKFIIPKFQKKKNKTATEDTPLDKFRTSLRNIHTELFLAKTPFGLDYTKIQNAEDFLNDAVYHLQSFKPTDELNLAYLGTVRYNLESYLIPYRNGAKSSEKILLKECTDLLEYIGKSFGADLKPS